MVKPLNTAANLFPLEKTSIITQRIKSYQKWQQNVKGEKISKIEAVFVMCLDYLL